VKAVVIHENGGPECIQIDDVPDPTPSRGEVVIRVHAAALNHLDIWVRRGRPGVELAPPHVLGSDATGVIASVGEDVTGLGEGDPVILNPGLSCGHCEFCLRGEQNVCPDFGLVGMSRPGTYAEFVAVPAENVYSVPDHLSSAEAAALPLAHLTAWRMLVTRCGLRPGESVLIHGIGGGVAIAALQIAHLAGAEVIVTSASDEKLLRARELGAHHTINYRSCDGVGEMVRDMTHGRGVDIAFDTTGAATCPINFEAVRRGGRMVHCGVTTGATAELNLSALYWNHFTIMGSTMGSAEDFRQMLGAIHAAGVKPVIDTVQPLARAREATMRMEEAAQFGKIVLEV
jgi:NADPH:quinone reductase-like Zn-dependent oxidoreductase